MFKNSGQSVCPLQLNQSISWREIGRAGWVVGELNPWDGQNNASWLSHASLQWTRLYPVHTHNLNPQNQPHRYRLMTSNTNYLLENGPSCLVLFFIFYGIVCPIKGCPVGPGLATCVTSNLYNPHQKTPD